MNSPHASGPKTIRVVSNTRWFDGQRIGGRPADVSRIAAGGFLRTLWNAIFARPCDVVVINNEPRQVLVYCLLKLLLPWAAWQIVSVDMVVQRPTNWRQRIRTWIARSLLRQVDRFLVFFKDTVEWKASMESTVARSSTSPSRSTVTKVWSQAVSDEGFILSCGQSKRDYATLCQAMEGLPYAAHILAQSPQVSHKHGTTFDFQSFPENVHWVTDDGSDASWIDWIARARCLVLPVLPDTLAASGISTYLVAMALGKCVVITDSPATAQLIDRGEAVIVPPADPAALRTALTEVMENAAYREKVAAAGHAYAIGLKDEKHMAADISVQVDATLRNEAGRTLARFPRT